jgi:RNase P/RNase MRP subunit POP5
VKAARRRYMALQIDSHETIGSSELMNAVWSAVSRLFGEYGASQTGLGLVGYDETERLVIIRTWHNTLEMVRTAIASITRIGNRPLALHVLEVSGTIKALYKKLER